MKLNGKTVLVCDCEGTMPLDGKAIAKACGNSEAVRINSHLCRSQIENFRNGFADGAPVLVACTQETRLFDETAGDRPEGAALTYVNIREQAGWSEEADKASPKIAALLAEAALDIPPTETVSLASQGVCLVYGRDEVALNAARQLVNRLDVTLLLHAPKDLIPPRSTEMGVFSGKITFAAGHLGAFKVSVHDYAPLSVSSRHEMGFGPAGAGVESDWDLILDLTGDAPLFPAPEKRDGYFNPDPRNPAAVQKALFEIVDLVGEFDKPRYVTFDPALCAHGRSGLTGCDKCLDACPASAIRSAGDVVVFDPYICGGCGDCHSVCPTGAAAYALPTANTLFERLRTLLATYGAAGGENPVLLVHDRNHGDEMISMMARFGRGLPANVLPFAVNEVTQVGLDLLSGGFAYGAACILVLVGPSRRQEIAGLEGQVELINTMLAGLGYGLDRARVIADEDPEKVAAVLHEQPRLDPPKRGGFLAMGNKRTLMQLALGHLHKEAPEPVDLLPLPEGAPFGSVAVDTAGCTLCLACVGACPTGALSDNPDSPRLSFTETACVQCGLCNTTCPEKVVRLEPRLNFGEDARGPVIKHEEEPFNCVRCGKPFGTKSAIARIVEQLAGKHSMFRDGKMIETIKMCEDCRVIARSEVENEVLAGPARPPMRTTEDYLRERELARQRQENRAKNRRANGGGDESQT